MPRVGVITGTRREAACLAPLVRAGIAVVACSGTRAETAEAAARRLVDAGCRALASIGTAGGLDPALDPGTVVIADAVHHESDTAPADAAWSARLAGGLGARRGLLAGADSAVGTVAGKARLFAETGALCIDMESHAVARAAARHGCAWTAIRVIADPAHRAFPAAIAGAVDADGRVRAGAVAAGLVRRPGEAADMLAMAVCGWRALVALRRVAAAGLFLEPL